ncbi:hypothetical protein [Caedibacter taeniospiralis]|uniref:hypothetical protein n=1 Tax=Caedibacter taeniospiralis TaxID=28907 RepID=UPI0037BF1323
MAIKKSALYASLSASCDELRGGMDGSQSLVVARFFAAEQAKVDALQSALDGVGQELESFIEENSGEEGLNDLRRFLTENHIKSIAIPPLGAGNGGLEWQAVKSRIEQVLADLVNVKIWVFEPTTKYQNVAKKSGVSKLSPARALVAELVRRYWILGIECSLLEIQKLVWFLQRVLEINGLKKVLNVG